MQAQWVAAVGRSARVPARDSFPPAADTGDVPGGGGGLGSPKETWSLPRSLGGGGGDAAAGGGVFAFGVCSEEAYEEAYYYY